jgi:methionine-S-sulfoxide reductase
VIRTRVGYAGGEKVDPTYRSLGGHSETIQIDYDPSIISYAELLDVYWDSHSPTSRPWSQQYASIIFYHDEDQKQLAVETSKREADRLGEQVFTDIVPFSGFSLAEDYHQKYRLQQVPVLFDELRALYPDHSEFVDSTVAARLNGYAGGYGTLEALRAEIGDMGLPPPTVDRLLAALSDFGSR